jgi:hypothetical protein
VQFGQCAVLQQFANPTPLFEHEDEHEHEDDFDAACERWRIFLTPTEASHPAAAGLGYSLPALRALSPTRRFRHPSATEPVASPSGSRYFLTGGLICAG